MTGRTILLTGTGSVGRELLLGFADLTRAADRPEGAPGTLGDELAAVRAYLQLEQARFGRRLQVEIAVDEGLHVERQPRCDHEAAERRHPGE